MFLKFVPFYSWLFGEWFETKFHCSYEMWKLRRSIRRNWLTSSGNSKPLQRETYFV